MSLFTPDTLDRVRDSADIVEVVSAYTDLRRQGERFVGLCPFHEERTPSFSVKPGDGFYYCFGCEAGGDTIRFVQEKEGLGFQDAVEALADRFGVELEREAEDPQAEARRRRRGRLGEALERASAFYEAYLWQAPKAARAREYLAQRGLAEEVLRAFGVGYAPNDWGSLLARGQRAGFTVEELKAAGLVQSGRKGRDYDVFRSRITFPVRDVRGRTVGFGARASLPDQQPKYKNSAEGELYRKSRTLYGIDRARAPIARSERAVVVEGYTDVLALHQAGVEETVAVMGTAITPDQLKLLGSYASEVVLALDADRAGREAMLRAQRVAGSGKLRLLVVAMPEGEDPAEMLALEGGEERFRRLLAEAVDLPVFHVRAILADADLATPAGRDRALDEVAPVLKAMGDTIIRQELISEVADRLETDPAMVGRRLSAAAMPRREQQPSRPAPVAAPQRSGGEPGDAGPAADEGEDMGPVPDSELSAPRQPPRAATVEERREDALLAMCIAKPTLGAAYIDRLNQSHLVAPRARRALEWLRTHLSDPLADLPREDDELFTEVSRLKLIAERQPVDEKSIELTWLMIERARIDREIAELRRGVEAEPAATAAADERGTGAGSEGDAAIPFERVVELQRERARIADAIASRGG